MSRPPGLIITEGVVFDGDCSMGAAKQKGGVAGSQSLNAEKVAVAQASKLQRIPKVDLGSPFFPSEYPTFIIEGRFFNI